MASRPGNPQAQADGHLGCRPGGLCIIGAAFNGASFLDYNKNVNSYLMALLFAAAVLCYVVILALPPAQRDQTQYFAASPDTQKANSAPGGGSTM